VHSFVSSKVHLLTSSNEIAVRSNSVSQFLQLRSNRIQFLPPDSPILHGAMLGRQEWTPVLQNSQLDSRVRSKSYRRLSLIDPQERSSLSFLTEIEDEKCFRSNQLNKQTNMMADFCYTNPTIVPGELLSRRGFSMYSGVDNFDEDFGKNKNHYGTYHEARSKF